MTKRNMTTDGAQAPLPPLPSQWLALKEASDFLGIHFTTLRSWADAGDIAVLRTPGGHRRFSLDDLRRFLSERSHHLAPEEPSLVEAAVVRVRKELERGAPVAQRWQYTLSDEAGQVRRARGRQLFALAIAYVVKPNQRPRLLESGRELGQEYGAEAALSGVGLAEMGRAVQFFRRQLAEAVRNEEAPGAPDADDVRIVRLIDEFLDEVLYAVLDGYEVQTRGLAS